jgi:hypothetical protein
MALVVDIPLHPIEVPEEKRCMQVMVNGERCMHEAVSKGRCDVHREWAACAMADVGMAMPEDAISLQVMLMKAMDMIVTDGVDPKKVNAMVELCKLMALNVRAYQFERGDVVVAAARRRYRK